MVLVTVGNKRFRLKLKKAGSPDNYTAHVVSEITAWKASANR